MNICMFTNTYIPHVGGVARSVSCFAEDLRKLGHRVLVVAPTYPGTSPGESEEGVLRIPAIQNFNGSDFSARIPTPFLIHHKVDEFHPDVIHSHHPYLLGDSALRVASRRSLPIVFTHHTRYEEYTHYVLSSAAMQKFVIRLSTAYANCCTSVIAPSRSIVRLIRQRGVNTPVIEIPTGIDWQNFQKGDGKRFREKMGIDENVRLIGHVGRIAPEKNVGYLIRAVRTHIRENRKAKFLVVGDGPDLQHIREAFAGEGLQSHLITPGKKTGKELVDAYCAMDVFVFSSHSETQGLVVTEAMAAGVPVIALDASGVREVVTDNRNGRLLPSGAPAGDFGDAISSFFSNSVIWDSWRESARETAREFDRMTMARKLSDHYGHVIGKKLKSAAEYNSILGRWENLRNTLKTEWDLLSSKVEAIAETIGSEEPENG